MRMGKKLKTALKEKTSPHIRTSELSPGFMIRHFREIQGMTQKELAEITGIAQPTISALESNTATLGIDRANVLARALKVNPGTLAFPDWNPEEEAA